MSAAIVNADVGRELSNFVEKLTTSGEAELDKDIMNKLKKICRLSDDNVRHVYYLVMTRLEEDHAEIRFSALQIIDVLFRRSHAFRDCLVSNLQRFLELTVETDPDEPLPPPKTVAKKLNKEALECIKFWHQTFGEGYKKLVLGYNFLKDCKKVNFENIDVRSVAERRREDDRRLRQDSIMNDRVNCVIKEMDDVVAEIRDCVNHIESCFKLLVPEPFESIDDEPQPCCSKSLPMEITEMDSREDDDDRGEDQSWLAHHGISSANYILEIAIQRSNFKVNVTGDNQSVVDVFCDHFKILQNKYIPMVLKWTQILGKSGQDHGGRLNLAVNIKNNLQQIVKKANLLSLHKESKESSDDEFVEVEPKEGYEPVIPQHLRKEYGLEPLKQATTASRKTENTWTVKPCLTEEEFKDPASLAANLLKAKPPTKISVSLNKSHQELNDGANNDASKKSELLAKAPKVRFDTDLLHWDEENPKPPTIVRYTSLHEFWQPFENQTEEIVRSEDVAAMRERVIEFSGKFEPVKRSCRAPLPNGGLCLRHDRFKCPFHGTIIPRDETGLPSKPEDRERLLKMEEEKQIANPEWQDPQLLKDIQAATGVDLTVKKGRKKKKKDSTGKGLADVSEKPKTTRERLEKKVFNSASVKRVAAMLDSFDAKKYKDKFGDQFNYSYHV